VDLKLTHPVKLKSVHTDIFLLFENLLDEAYETHYGYPDDGLCATLGLTMEFCSRSVMNRKHEKTGCPIENRASLTLALPTPKTRLTNIAELDKELLLIIMKVMMQKNNSSGPAGRNHNLTKLPRRQITRKIGLPLWLFFCEGE